MPISPRQRRAFRRPRPGYTDNKELDTQAKVDAVLDRDPAPFDPSNDLDLGDEVQALADDLLGYAGTWDEAVEYKTHDIVEDGPGGPWYRAVQGGTGHPLTDSAYWQPLPSALAPGDYYGPAHLVPLSPQPYTGFGGAGGVTTFASDVHWIDFDLEPGTPLDFIQMVSKPVGGLQLDVYERNNDGSPGAALVTALPYALMILAGNVNDPAIGGQNLTVTYRRSDGSPMCVAPWHGRLTARVSASGGAVQAPVAPDGMSGMPRVTDAVTVVGRHGGAGSYGADWIVGVVLYTPKAVLGPLDPVDLRIPGGVTDDRPSLRADEYGVYYDKDLGKPVFWSGSGWTDATGAPA